MASSSLVLNEFSEIRSGMRLMQICDVVLNNSSDDFITFPPGRGLGSLGALTKHSIEMDSFKV